MTTVDEPGTARCPGPSTRELIEGDATPTPAPILAERYEFLGDADIPFADYTSVEQARAEDEHVWGQVWQWACREEHVPEPGDYHVYDIGHRSVVIVRGPDHQLRGFVNVCLHRGTQLKPPGSVGWSPKLRCPFHGWQWDLEGNLDDVPCRWDFPHVTDERFVLPQVHVEVWGGFVFVSFADDPPPLRRHLGALADHFEEAGWDLGRRYVEVHVRKRLPANWKAALAAFLEAYHVIETHSQSILVTGDANAQYDVFDDHVSRFVHTIGTTSPHVPDDQRPTEEQILRMLLHDRGDDPLPEIPEGQRARDVFARLQRAELSERYGVDLSGASVTETIDSIEYFLFPNACFFPGLQLPMVYRFRPDGDDVDHCIFEILLLRPHPADGDVPEPAEPVDLDVDDSYTTSGLPGSLGAIYDQDTGNLAAQTRGFRASAKGGQTLGNYQEVRVRHLHQTIAAYLRAGSVAR